ncbi:hypothetical protein BCR32DRAFT_298097 [Anaeromyces robustus]|uniref:NHL repeat-containing protein n=1 Tax=Anaeromyces robustus TaxID=1754192 RepID=A0A1Y1VUF1_9FUNG|nr:hypothetical protein BCR32DRAFT_298097 [Anaeromyces robustus]|eukprot:ORX64374.1 hypothetical protein BCR32DRAFT_298097 [Anaeromyces robustus]
MKLYLLLLISFLIQCSLGRYLETRDNKNDLPSISKTFYKDLDIKIPELSGLKLSASNDFLWGIGDEGQLAQITLKYKVTLLTDFQGIDTEGITIDSKTGDLIVCVEPNTISRITKSSNYKNIVNLFTVKEAAGWKEDGLEGITLFNETQIYVGSQRDALLWHYDIKGNLKKRIELKKVASQITEVADLCYDEEKNRLWVIDSAIKTIFLFNGEVTKLLKTYKLSSSINNPESIAIDRKNGNIWVGEDDDETYRLFRIEMKNL